MKVRCIDGSWTSNELTTGKEYEVLSEVGCYYQLKINDKGIEYHCYAKSRFEIVEEDNKMQEKTFREVIADIKEREVWICEKFNRKIIKGDDGVIEIRKLNDETFDNISAILFRDEIYMLQRKQYSFEEAFKAYEDGKEIESCISNDKFKKVDNCSWKFKTTYMDEYSDYMSNETEIFSVDEIRGKWHINN